MKLKKIEINGLKTHNNRVINFTGCDILTGPNGAGKTGIMQAITLHHQGYIPELGKKEAAQMRLSNNGKIEVSGTYDNGFNFKRTFSGSVASAKQNIEICGVKQNVREADQEIKTNIGNSAIMFDLKNFTNLSAEKKREYILQFIQLKNKDLFFDVVFECAKIKLDLAAIDSILEFKFDNKAISELSESELVEFTNILIDKSGIRVYIDSLEFKENSETELSAKISEIKESINNLKKKIDETKAAKKRLLEDKQRYELESAGLVELTNELNQLAADRDNLLKQLNTEENRKKNYQKLIEKKNQTLALFEDIDVKLKNLLDENKTADIINQITTLKSECAALELSISEFEDLLNNNKELQKCYEATINSNARLNDAFNKIIDAFPEVISENEKVKKFIDEAMLKCKEATSEYSTKLEKVNNEIKNIENEKKVVSDDLKTKQNKITALQVSLPDTNYKTALIEKHQFYMNEAFKLEKELLNETTAVNEDEIKAQLAGIEKNIESKNVLKKEKEKSKTIAETILNQLSDETELTKMQELLKMILAGLTNVRLNIVSDFTEPLHNKINELLRQINPDWDCYFELIDDKGKDVFNFGLLRNNVQIPYDALSGGEDKLFSSALAIALLNLENLPVRILCVEAAEIDIENLKKLCAGLYLLKNYVDNIILATWVNEKETLAITGWNVIELQGKNNA